MLMPLARGIADFPASTKIVRKEISRLLSDARRNGRAGTHTPQSVIDTDYELRFKAGLQVVAK